MNKIKNIGELLLEYRMITREELDKALVYQKDTGLKLGEALVKLGVIKQDEIDYILSRQVDEPFVILDDLQIDDELVRKFDTNFLKQNRILPIYEDEHSITVATDDPFNEDAFEILRSEMGKDINLVVSYGRKIEEALSPFDSGVTLDQLQTCIRKIISFMENTSFYRVDFIGLDNGLFVNIFGFGIILDFTRLSSRCSVAQLQEALKLENVDYFYRLNETGHGFIFCIYPITTDTVITPDSGPIVCSGYGLVKMGGLAFSDMDFSGSDLFFKSEQPVNGYYFYSFERFSGYSKSINIVDNLKDFSDKYIVKGFIPSKCVSCGAKGCEKCGFSGYTFSEIEENDSSEKVFNKLNEVLYGQN